MTSKYGLLISKIPIVDSDKLHEMISINAYYKAEKRDFAPEHELEDWLEAELELIDRYAIRSTDDCGKTGSNCIQ